ncbi:hypothetical protein HPB51_015573 [Rhipicephalus microplus]|uniref:Uncharacterized protein n=1 Tax=Rhipicephalus microplus TaxID=6941 RepID=A0A9J6DHP1_RHIMP|nr:hypothetical protein HPB51_015573 [Rhipicephalus microplus]
MHNKPKPIKAPAAQKSRPPTFSAEDFPSVANPPKQASHAATPPPPSEPVAMHTSDCSDDEQDTQSDVSGNTSVPKTVVGASNDIEGRLSRLETKLEEQSKMILEQSKLTVQEIIPQQLNLSLQAAMQDLKQSVLPILTASVLKTIQNWLTPQWDQLKASIKTTEQPRRKIVHRNLANSESESNIAQPSTKQTESPTPLQAPTLAAVAKMTPPQ